jgi:DNA mismatch repair ATPase MutS
MLIKEINKNFLLPIEFDKQKQEIFENLYEDLELLKQVDSNKTIYSKTFRPKSTMGHELLDKWCKYYTTNTEFLKDSQKLYKSVNKSNLLTPKPIIEKCWENWTNIKTMDNFIEKFQYIEWEKLEFLNKSEMFLAVLTFYQTISPLLSLLAPIILLIIPFLILKVLKKPITVEEYVHVLQQQLDKHSMGQLFTRFDSLSWGQRIYLIMCCGMYVYQIYQNGLACYHFYLNTKQINQTFRSLKLYLEHTKSQMKTYITLIKPLKSHTEYRDYISDKLEHIEKLSNIINSIPLTTLNPQKFASMGKIMKEFYILQTNPEIQNLLLFTFGFNGYIDCIQGVSTNIKLQQINKINIKKSKKVKLYIKNAYHPCISDNIVQNTVDMSKNIIITGPNAAGKTTLLKTTVINVLLAQQIGYGFHQGGYITPFYSIHCYLNIPDTNARDSLFQAEARRCVDILNYIKQHKNKKHFCIFDELYSGTNPYEAVATAYSYLNFITENPNIRFMLTTHYIRLCKLFRKHAQVDNYNMGTEIKDDIPKYSYKMVKGVSKIKGGIIVLKQLNYPIKILNEANKIINKL